MRKRYRSHLGILLDILRVIHEENGATLSRIIMMANIPHVRLREYLKKLEDSGYIIRMNEGNRIIIKLTEKGLKFLNYLEKLGSMINELGFPL